jgi:predicted RNase H-like HicB family nuclease
MNIDYTVQIWKEGGQYVAHAMPLDVASSGQTPEGARSAVDEAVRAFVDSCTNAGTLEEVLEEAGYERGADGQWQSPAWVSVERRELAIGA